MRAKKGFNLRTICGEQIIVAEGKENIDFSNIISMNDTSAFLWEAITGRDFTTDVLADLLTEHYSIDRSTAMADAEQLITQWIEAGIVEESINEGSPHGI